MKKLPLAKNERVPRNLWDRAPWNQWSFQHIREILPTVEVWRGSGAIWKLDEKEIDLSYEEARTEIYGMTYETWKDQYQAEATAEQLAALEKANL